MGRPGCPHVPKAAVAAALQLSFTARKVLLPNRRYTLYLYDIAISYRKGKPAAIKGCDGKHGVIVVQVAPHGVTGTG